MEAALVAGTTATVGFAMIYFLNDCRPLGQDPTKFPIQVLLFIKYCLHLFHSSNEISNENGFRFFVEMESTMHWVPCGSKHQRQVSGHFSTIHLVITPIIFYLFNWLILLSVFKLLNFSHFISSRFS